MKLFKKTLTISVLVISLFQLNINSIEAKETISCESIKKYDEENKLNGSLNFWFGCENPPLEEILKNYSTWPETMRIWFMRNYYIPNEEHLNFQSNADKILQLIGNGNRIDQKILASIFVEEHKSIYEILYAGFNNITDEIEKAFYFYVAYVSPDYYDYVKTNKIETYNFFNNTDVGRFYSHRIQMIFDGFMAPAEEEAAIQKLENLIANNNTYYWNRNRLRDFYSTTDKIEKMIELERELYEENNIDGMIEYARSLNHGVGIKLDEYEHQKILGILALYGVPKAQQLLASSYKFGWGEMDKDLANIWFEKAASNGNKDAIYYLLHQNLDKADYKIAYKYSLQLSQLGEADYLGSGYLLSSLLLHKVYDDKNTINKLSQFLYMHCTNNRRVADKEECSSLGITEKKFKSNDVLLTDVYKDPLIIKYSSEIELKPGKYKALLIANSEYNHWDNLETPKNDVLGLSMVLKEQYGFETEIILNKDRRSILQSIYQQGNELTFNDHFLLYYAGHGVINNQNDEAYWIPSDAARDTPIDWISSNEIMSSLKSIKTRHLMLIADSCYSGALLRGNAQSLSDWGPGAIERLFSKKAKVALTSGGEEPVADSGGGNNSVFASALMDVLKEASGPTPASGIYPKLVNKISGNANQTPRYDNLAQLDHDGGDFVFIPKQ